MKKLTCEMCGSTDLVKQEGVFRCQSCDSKYSIEEAKKMMTEDTVEISRAVKVDNNLYQLARRAKNDGNGEAAAKYYAQILSDDPNSWEATFYSAYYAALQQYRNDKTGSAIITVQNCLDSVFNLIMNNYQDIDPQKAAISEVTNRIFQINDFLLTETEKEWRDYGENVIRAMAENNHPRTNAVITENNERLVARVVAISKTYASLGVKLLEIFGDDCELGKKGISSIEKGIDLVENRTVAIMKRRDKKEITNSYRERMTYLIAESAKRRFKEYWDAHPSERANLESEKQFLIEQITVLQKEIAAIPEKTDGYADMVELQKKNQNLISEKKALGFFKFKDKKLVQAQIDSINHALAPIYTRINTAIEAVRKQIFPLEGRINAINTELTKPR